MKGNITEDNCKQALFDYAMEHYTEEDSEKAMDQFPYAIEGTPEEVAWKDFIDWFIMEYKQPKTGRTIAEEFAEKMPLDPELKKKLLQMTQIHSSTFKVVENKKDIIQVVDINRGKQYTIQLIQPDRNKYRKGRVIDGRIHPWGEVYRFAGAFVVRSMPEDYGFITEQMTKQIMKRMFDKETGKLENIVVNQHTRTSAMLNKYPFQWIDGIAKVLGIDVKMLKDDKIRQIVSTVTANPRKIIENLPQKCQKAMNEVLQEGGIMRYGSLAKNYDDEIDFWWNEHPPKSTLGLLRLHGLLYVGKLPMNGKLVKVAFVPKDLRESLVVNVK